jgi:hypothetical protein
MATITETTTNKITIKPTPIWTPLPIEGDIPPPYKTPKFGFEVIPLHPTFACELQGVDFSAPLTPEQYSEIRAVSDKVGSENYGTGKCLVDRFCSTA